MTITQHQRAGKENEDVNNRGTKATNKKKKKKKENEKKPPTEKDDDEDRLENKMSWRAMHSEIEGPSKVDIKRRTIARRTTWNHKKGKEQKI